MTNSFGSFQLVTAANLPNAVVAFPGEHWSDGKAAEIITPGQLVVPSGSGATPSMHSLTSKKVWSVASAGAIDPRSCIALRTVQVPDINPGSEFNPQLTPNQIMNRPIPVGEYVHTYRAGAFHLTLIAADSSYEPGDLLGWDPSATAQAGKPAGVGAWIKIDPAAHLDYGLLEVEEWRPLAADDTLGVLTAKTLRVQD